MKKLATLTGLLLLLASPAFAQSQQTPVPYFTSGFDPSNQQANFNTLIQKINYILTPLQPNIQGAVNFLQLVPSISGNGPVVGVQAGGDGNAPIRVVPAGNGDIILFSSALSAYSQGHIKVGNMASWVPAPGLQTCPGATAGKPAALGVSATVTGYLLVKDWLDHTRAMPGC